MMEGSQEADDAFEGTLEAIQGDSALVQVGCFFFSFVNNFYQATIELHC